uniref:Putative RING finger E3 ubiquitin ligase n=1 Tax=Pithovirus LCPAC404 TaxID=2506597 RepID=A0A481ZCL8_9VIRU|nr:MAG: putative RING finger E3 ubiquitin ligase [Pithovirus LCPAC404]
MSQQCEGTTLRNARCKRKVRNGTLCYQHKKSTSKAPAKKSTSKAQIKKNKSEEKELTLFGENCPICLDDFTKINRVTFKCGHGVCADCFIKLIDHDEKCPQCRVKYKLVEHVPSKVSRAIKKRDDDVKRKLRDADERRRAMNEYINERLSNDDNTMLLAIEWGLSFLEFSRFQ